jgi:hypothetical protein
MIAGEHLCSRGLAQEFDESGNSLQSIRLSAKQDCSLVSPVKYGRGAVIGPHECSMLFIPD